MTISREQLQSDITAAGTLPSASERAPQPGRPTGPGPLSGIRILDMTSFQSGPMVTLMAGDMGAEVIKVEALQRLDGWRGSGRSGERPWENSPNWNWISRNKKDVTLNLTDPRGRDLCHRLADLCDVVVENFTPRVMANFGMDYDGLRANNPQLIMLSMPGFGDNNPWRDYTAFAWTTEQMSTICNLTSYEDSGPQFSGTTCGDPLAGLMGAISLFAAINHRRRTGEGQHIDLSQVEAATSFVGDVLVEAQVNQADPPRRGNRHPKMAPHGMYPCRGEDRWVAIACRSDAEWATIWREVGGRAAADEVRYPTLAERLAASDELDALLSSWTRQRDPHEVMHCLQGQGVPAAVVMDGPDLLADPHLEARDYFVVQDRNEIGPKHYPKQPFRMAVVALPTPVRAPYLGEHNEEVLGGLLGVTAAQLAELERDRVIGTRPASH